jgi:hypothetical protein
MLATATRDITRQAKLISLSTEGRRLPGRRSDSPTASAFSTRLLCVISRPGERSVQVRCQSSVRRLSPSLRGSMSTFTISAVCGAGTAALHESAVMLSQRRHDTDTGTRSPASVCPPSPREYPLCVQPPGGGQSVPGLGSCPVISSQLAWMDIAPAEGLCLREGTGMSWFGQWSNHDRKFGHS